MKKWTMLLALLLATVFCFPGALAEQEAVESTGIMVAGSWSPMFTSRAILRPGCWLRRLGRNTVQ